MLFAPPYVASDDASLEATPNTYAPFYVTNFRILSFANSTKIDEL